LRGIWTKINKTTVEFSNPQWFDTKYVFYDIPKTNIGFDQYQIATFMDKGVNTNYYSKDEEENYSMFRERLRGLSLRKIGKLHPDKDGNPLHPEAVERKINDFVDCHMSHSYPLVVEQPNIVTDKP
jgi:hypothetical protein